MADASIPAHLVRLLERIQASESLDLEFKAARTALPKNLWETVSAFANTNGGWIVLGVSEGKEGSVKEGPVIEGVQNAATQLERFYNLIRSKEKISHAACGPDDASIELLGGQQIIVLRIPSAPRRERPVFVNANPYTGTYVRRHSGDYRCTKQEVDRMIRDAAIESADSAILKGFEWADLEADTLAGYRRRFQTRNPASPWNSYDDQRFMEAIRGYRRDRETGQEGITVAGLLLVGTSEAIRDWRPYHLIDYRQVPGDVDSDVRWDDRIVWNGNLVGAFTAIYPRLVADLPIAFRLVGATRVDDGPVHVALREALVNLLVHADYAETTVSLIKRSPRGFFYRNPGSSLVPDVDLFTSDRSEPRNPTLLDMFRFIGLAERAGSGMPNILKTWRDLGFRLPEINIETERYEFSLNLRYAHLLSGEDRIWLEKLGGDWSEAERMALVIARHDGGVNNLKLRGVTGHHSADVTKILGGLRDRGFLEMTGIGRGARYQLGLEAAYPLFAPLATAEQIGGVTQPSLMDMPVGSDSSTLSSDSLPVKSASLADNSDTVAARTDGQWAELQTTALAVSGRRHLRAEERDSIIVQLCARSTLSLHELAELLHRSEPLLRTALRSLIASGRLTYLYPDRPNHPAQRYIAANQDPKDS